MVHAHNPSTQEDETGRFQVQGQGWVTQRIQGWPHSKSSPSINQINKIHEINL